MEIIPIKTEKIIPPQDDLFAKIKHSSFAPQDNDVIAITSKVVSIHEGRCVNEHEVKDKDELIKREADLYLKRSEVPGGYVMHTHKDGVIVPSSGIDKSNSDEYFVLWPKDPIQSAKTIRQWILKTYELSEVFVVLTDSHSTPLRRGVTGFTLGFAGFDPLFDYREEKDIFGDEMHYSMINLPDSLAAAATLAMGEGNEQTPLAIIRNAPHVAKTHEHKRDDFLEYNVPMDEDLYAPFLKNAPWKKGGKK